MSDPKDLAREVEMIVRQMDVLKAKMDGNNLFVALSSAYESLTRIKIAVRDVAIAQLTAVRGERELAIETIEQAINQLREADRAIDELGDAVSHFKQGDDAVHG